MWSFLILQFLILGEELCELQC
uniref:Uncharacterized protein n=1 Tax=Rhizophora mucronata TaxID=61149 RepID=A0A2P2NWH0_RHIMU